MLAPALMVNPRLLIVDDATEGLGKLRQTEIWTCIARSKDAGLGIRLGVKTLDALLKLSDRRIIIERGVTVWSGTPDGLLRAPEVRDRYLHL